MKDSRIPTILAAFALLLSQLLTDFIQKVLVGFGEYSMALKKKPFACKCGNDANFIWKTRHGKKTKIHGFQKTAFKIDFKLDANELRQGEADGTGIGIKGIAKRGKELKVFVQYKQGGGVRVAGLDLGNYNGSWNKLFQNSIEVFKGFSEFLLLTDGDTSILDGLKDKVKVIFQRCLWHIPHQAKYVLWQDVVKRKSPEWLYVIAEIMEICAIRPFVDCQQPIEMMIESKKKHLEEVIKHCQENGYTRTVSYLFSPELV